MTWPLEAPPRTSDQVRPAVRAATDHLLVVRQAGRQGPLELHHPLVLATELDDVLIAGPVAEEVEPARREGLVDLGEVEAPQGAAVAQGAQVAEDHHPTAGPHLRAQPAQVGERLRDLLGLEPGDDAAVARHHPLVREPLIDVVVLDHEPEPVERHLGPAMDLVGGRGLGPTPLHVVVELGRLVERQHVARQLPGELRVGGRGVTAGSQQPGPRRRGRAAQQRAARDPPAHGRRVWVETWSSPMVDTYGTKPRARARRMSSAGPGLPSAAAYSSVNTSSPSAATRPRSAARDSASSAGRTR